MLPPGSDTDPHIQEAFAYVAGVTATEGGGGAPPPQFAHQQPGAPHFPGGGFEFGGIHGIPGTAPSWWSNLVGGQAASNADLQLAFMIMTMYMAVETMPVADMTYRFWPALFERVPYSDVVIKAALLGLAVLAVKRVFATPPS